MPLPFLDEGYFSPYKVEVLKAIVKENDTFTEFAVYPIKTWKQDPSGAFTPFGEVRRRYKDFEWLHKSITSSFPFLLVPSLPMKQLFGTFRNIHLPIGNLENDFLALRRIGLHQYLNHLLQMECLLENTILHEFLQNAVIVRVKSFTYSKDWDKRTKTHQSGNILPSIASSRILSELDFTPERMPVLEDVLVKPLRSLTLLENISLCIGKLRECQKKTQLNSELICRLMKRWSDFEQDREEVEVSIVLECILRVLLEILSEDLGNGSDCDLGLYGTFLHHERVLHSLKKRSLRIDHLKERLSALKDTSGGILAFLSFPFQSHLEVEKEVKHNETQMEMGRQLLLSQTILWLNDQKRYWRSHLIDFVKKRLETEKRQQDIWEKHLKAVTSL